MNWTDVVNGCFEGLAGLMVAFSCLKTYKDKKVRGVAPVTVAFFTLWGFWNIYFYPVNGFTWSFIAGLLVVTANLTWVGMLIYYTRKEKKQDG